MSDYTNTPIGSGYNTNASINTELSAVETAVNSKLDKSGSTMTGELDMNSKKIINLPDATTLQEPVTYGQMINGASFAAADAKYFDTVALATADTTLAVGDVVIIEERASGIFDVVTVGTTPNVDLPNTRNVIVSVADPTTCFVLRENIIVNPLSYGGSTIAQSINRALLSLRTRTNLVPWTIQVPQNKDGAAYDWDEVVDISDDSWVTLRGDGYIAIKATAAISSFFTIGISNKNNETDLSYFSCDAGDQTMTAAVVCGSMRGVDIHHIETKATGTGSFTDGILVGGDDEHTGSEAGAGNEQCTIHHIFDSGDSAVTRDMVHFKGGTSLGVQCYNIRATREEFDNVVGSSTNSGFNGCSFHDIHANFLVERTIKANSLVNLKRSVNNTKVYNIGATSNPSQNNVNYGLLVDSLDGGIVSGALHAENLGVGYITDDISVPSTVVRTHINGVSFNNGDPNSQGVISATSSVKEKGGVVWDDTNKNIFVGKTGAASNDYETPLLKRIVSIADDSFFKYTYPALDYRLTGAIVSVVPEMSAGTAREGLVSLRATGTAAANKLTTGALFSVTTGALTGTTGTDTHVTVSADSADGSIYVENRTGAARSFIITWLS